MGLVGRLEDLPVPDIVQIVYLSRGTGVLELRLPDGRHTVLFRGGLIANATSPVYPSLRHELHKRMDLAGVAREVPAGKAALERNLIALADLQKIVTARIVAVVRGICDQQHGEFEFVSREPTESEIEYPAAVLPNGGIRPDHILGKNPVRLRTLGTVKQALGAITERVLAPLSEPPASPASPAPTPAPEEADRILFLMEEDAGIRAAIARAAGGLGLAVVESTPTDAHARLSDLFRRDRLFAAVISLGAVDPRSVGVPMVLAIKQKNRRVPIAVLDRISDFKRRHLALEAGADWYMRKPSAEAEEERAVFAADLLLAIDRRLAEQTPVRPATPEAGPMHRGFRLLVQLMKEVSDPGDLTQITLTVLQLAADYLDRGVLFAVKDNQYVTLGKFGINANGSGLRFRRGDLALLDKVALSGRPVRGPVAGEISAQIESALGGKRIQEVIALPMLSGDKVIGVLYGDNAMNRAPIEDTVGLEIFLAQAGFAFHNILFPEQPLPPDFSGNELQLV